MVGMQSNFVLLPEPNEPFYSVNVRRKSGFLGGVPALLHRLPCGVQLPTDESVEDCKESISDVSVLTAVHLFEVVGLVIPAEDRLELSELPSEHFLRASDGFDIDWNKFQDDSSPSKGEGCIEAITNGFVVGRHDG